MTTTYYVNFLRFVFAIDCPEIREGWKIREEWEKGWKKEPG